MKMTVQDRTKSRSGLVNDADVTETLRWKAVGGFITNLCLRGFVMKLRNHDVVSNIKSLFATTVGRCKLCYLPKM